ncbi:MAG: hypothetical protein DRI71_06665 [Bacteroidetes bacterium]|nr:MAG: hypothetical protein DRI71_06665 [Bacteroidota bacterium]
MEANQITPIGKNILLFFQEKEVNDKIKFDSGVEFYLDTSFQPTFSAKDSGVAVSTVKKTYIPDGARIFVDYLVHTQKDNPPILKDQHGVYYMAEEKDVFLWEKDGKVQTVGDWIIVEMDKEAESKTIIIMPKKKQETFGTVRFVNDDIEKNIGLKVGDRVMVDKRYNYNFKYDKEELARVDFKIGLFGIKTE